MVKKLLCGIYLAYLLVSAYTIAHHEPWNDELHSWNIARTSGSFTELLGHIRYEGHPPVWYTVLWVITRFTHVVGYMQLVHYLLAAAVVFLLLFLSPIPTAAKLMLPFGYYFLFEYAALSRNYAPGVLLALGICYVLTGEFRAKYFLYYLLLFLLSNVHLLAVILAVSLHLYFLLQLQGQKTNRSTMAWHALLGLIVILPSLYFISPPPDSEENFHFFTSHWTFSQITSAGGGPLNAFLPIPAWWESHFWNKECLQTAAGAIPVLRFVNPVLAFSLLVLAATAVWKNKKCRALFLANTGLTLLLAISFLALRTARHSGYLFVGFVVAWWLYCAENPASRKNTILVCILLALQLPGGLFAAVMDIRRPFSNLYRLSALLRKVPDHHRIVTDYWTMEGFSAFMDQPVYCLDAGRMLSFMVWDAGATALQKDPARYTRHLPGLLDAGRTGFIYLVTQNPPDLLTNLDPELARSFRITMVDAIGGAIEDGGNIYLYKLEDGRETSQPVR
jgi:hypothetical protein